MSAELVQVRPSDDVIRRIAAEVGKHVVHHIETMYIPMTDAVAWKSARISIRNTTHNAIVAAVNAANQGRIEAWIDSGERARRRSAKMRNAKSVDEIIAIRDEL